MPTPSSGATPCAPSAASALAGFRDAGSVPALAAAIGDTAATVRRAAARALAGINTEEAIEALRRTDPGDDTQLRAIIDRAVGRRQYRF